MSKELMWLTLTVILTGLLWVPYIIDRAMVRGLMGCDGQPVAQRQAAERLGRSGSISPTPMRWKTWSSSRRWC